MSELKPCPFCGGRAKFINKGNFSSNFSSGFYYSIKCVDLASCGVAAKESRRSQKVADLSEFWSDQKYIKLLDPNILAFKEHLLLLQQLVDSKAYVDFTQGLDARLLTVENIALINQIRLKEIHFAWDYMKEEKPILRGLSLYKKYAKHKPHGHYGSVYVLYSKRLK